ncbi:hypothetical protein ACHAWX_003487, partial [Stephanocyclus meneghinianus]
MTEVANERSGSHTDDVEMETASAAASTTFAEKDVDSQSWGTEEGDATTSAWEANEASGSATLTSIPRLLLPLDKARKRKRKKIAVALFSDDDEDDEKKHRVGLLDLNSEEPCHFDANVDTTDGVASVSSEGQGLDIVGENSGEREQLVVIVGFDSSGQGEIVTADGVATLHSEGTMDIDHPLSNDGLGHQEQQPTMETLHSQSHNLEQPSRNGRDTSLGVTEINMDQDYATKISNVAAFSVHTAMSNPPSSTIHDAQREHITVETKLDAKINQHSGDTTEVHMYKRQEITDHPAVDGYSTHDIGGAHKSQTFPHERVAESEDNKDSVGAEESPTSSVGHAAESDENSADSLLNAYNTHDVVGTHEIQGNTSCSPMQANSTKSASLHATGSTSENHQLQAQQQKMQPQHQPPGWRVKLYRLNKDGTWDDCGTGRIQFYFAKANQSQIMQHQNPSLQEQQHQQQQQHSSHPTVATRQKKATHDTKTHPAHVSSEHSPPLKQPPQNFQSLHQAVFRELGEPMLCMRAEIPPQPEPPQQQSHGEEISSNNAGNKVLLRTRVLLNNAYQCQGGNIITWCEPFHVQGGGQQQQQQGQQQQQHSRQQHSTGRGPPPYQQIGVDLALSFQDNAGFKDIWQHILDVQLRAKELSHFWTRSGHGNVHASSSAGAASKTLSLDVVSSTTHNNSIGQTGHFNDTQTPFQHHSRQPLSPEKNHHPHVHQPLSPNSPDHDALEDRQLSMVTLPKHPPLWSGHHAQSHHSSTSQNQQRQQHQGQQTRDGEKENDDHFRESSDGLAASSAWASYGTGGGKDSCSSNHCHKDTVGEGEDANEIDRAPSPLSLYHETHTGGGGGIGFDTTISASQLPDSPKWSDLDEIIDAIAGMQIQQREDMLIFLSQSDCAYIKSLLGLFHSAPEDQLDRGGLAALAVCIKSILLLNDPEIIEYVTTDEETFESVCGVLEYNPELREKANYRVFIHEQAKFRTVVKMEDEDLMSYIHRLFRVNYLKDFILRPTMDESSLSTLVSLAQFTQSDIIKGVMRLVPRESDPSILTENYFSKVLRVLGIEIKAIRKRRWDDSETVSAEYMCMVDDAPESLSEAASESLSNSRSPMSTMWHQHVAPQDSSMQSRYVRRKGCLHFLKELFNMARASLQQQEKDEFISSCVKASVKLTMGLAEEPPPDYSSEIALHDSPPHIVSLLLLLGAILSDSDADINEKSSALEILSVVTLHDTAIVRWHCLNSSNIRSGGKLSNLRPEPDELRQIVFLCPPDDLLQSLLFLMSTESDAGLLLQTSEIMRVILDTEILGEQATLDDNGFLSDENDLGPSGHGINGQNWNSFHESAAGGLERSEQNNFLAMFYDRYLQWLFSPFLYKVLVPKAVFPLDASPETIVQAQNTFRQLSSAYDMAFRLIPPCAIRSTFTLEILSFCVRAHVYRMKLYVLRTRLLSTTLKILSQKSICLSTSDDRCLKLACLKLLRSVLSVKDEFYHRHIVQYNLFAPVFELFRSLPVGNNLVSSAILEMCDFIRTENIKSLIEYIVTRHISSQLTPNTMTSLEDIANPHVDTFKQLRKKHLENSLPAGASLVEVEEALGNQTSLRDLHDNVNGVRPTLNEKALDDQRKFRESDEEESYFNDDSIDTEGVLSQKALPTGG